MDNSTDYIVNTYATDDFISVCTDNIRALKKGQVAFVYRKDVLEKTKELCDEEKIEYEILKEDWYYTIINKNKKSQKEKFYRNKNGK